MLFQPQPTYQAMRTSVSQGMQFSIPITEGLQALVKQRSKVYPEMQDLWMSKTLCT